MPELQPVTVPAEEAAARLGITVDAVRKRIARGRLTGHKAAGRWYVTFDGDTGPDSNRTTGQDKTRTRRQTGQDRTGQPDTPPADVAARLAALEADNAALRGQLADLQQDRDAWREQAQAVTTALQQQQALAVPDRMKDMPPAIEARSSVWQRLGAFLTRKL